MIKHSEIENLIEVLTYLDYDLTNPLLGFMKVFGYFDASGHHDGKDVLGNDPPAVIVAGYLSTPLKWKQFDLRWNKMLADFNVPHFHAADLMSRKGPFLDWQNDRVHALISESYSVINSCVIYGLGMAVMRKDYDEVCEAHPAIKEIILRSPYSFCTLRCWESGVDWARSSQYDETIKYIFESGDPGQHDVLEAHSFACEDEAVRKFWRFNVGGLTFEDGKKITPLQAADFLSYSLYKEQYRLTYNPTAAQRPTVQGFLEIPGTYKFYVKEHLLDYIKDAVEDFREQQQNEKET